MYFAFVLFGTSLMGTWIFANLHPSFQQYPLVCQMGAHESAVPLPALVDALALKCLLPYFSIHDFELGNLAIVVEFVVLSLATTVIFSIALLFPFFLLV